MEIAIDFKTGKKYQNRKTLEAALAKNHIPKDWPYMVVTEPEGTMIKPVFVSQHKHMPEMIRVIHCGYMLVGG